MNTKDLLRLGVPLGEATRRATDFISKFILSGGDKTRLQDEVKAIVAHPAAFTHDKSRGDFAKAKSTYDRCVDLLSSVPGNQPVAFRTPCCDSLI